MDLGLPLLVPGPGDVEDVRVKGLFRFCPGFDAIMEIGLG